jgi:hypothetical protein
MKYTVVAQNTGDCYPEQLYGQSERPQFDTREEAEACAKELLPGARTVAPEVRFVVIQGEEEDEA